jgi:hypothetical protein
MNINEKLKLRHNNQKELDVHPIIQRVLYEKIVFK